MIRDLMTEALEKRFQGQMRVPRALQWLSDNGPCYIARDTVEFGRSLGFEVCTTAPYSPESNGMAEAFVKTFKRDYAYLSDLKSEKDILHQLSAWFEDYNESAPHKGLKMMSPREYRRTISAD
jgi:transposase InsO family protein